MISRSADHDLISVKVSGTFNTAGFGQFKTAVEEFIGSIGSGSPAVEKFRNDVADIGNANPALARTAADLLAATQAAGETADKINAAERALRLLRGTATAADREGLGLSNPKPAALPDPFARQVISVEKHIAAINADNAAVGKNVGEHERLRVEAQLLEAAQQNGRTATAAQRAEIERLGDAAGRARQALAEKTAQSQADFAKQTVFMSDTEKQIAAVNFQLHGDKWKDYADSALSNTMRITAVTNELFKTAQQGATQFTGDLISGLGRGESATESLHGAFKNLASSLTSGALKSLFEGDFISAGIKGIAAVGAAIFSANTSTSGDKWLKQQTENMQQRASDISARMAMIGVDTNTRAGAILAQDAAFHQQRLDENRSGGQKMNDLLQLQILERNQLMTAWDKKETDLLKQNADAKLAIEKAANDRALGFQNRLFAATNDFSTLEGQLAAFDRSAAQERLIEAANDNNRLVDLEAASAAERLNVIKSYNEKIVADTEAAAKAQQDAVNSTAKNITDFVNGLYAGSNSTLSPTARRAAAGSTFSSQFALAQSGDPAASARITQDAQNLLDAERAISASSIAFQQLRDSVASQLLSLPAVQNTTDPSIQVMRDVLAAIVAGNATQAKDATVADLLTDDQLRAIGLAKDGTVGALLTKAQLDTLGIATSESVGRLLTASQLAQQGLASNAVVSGLLTEGQIRALGLSRDSTNQTLLTKAQLEQIGLATDTKLGTLLTPQQLADAHLASDTTVGTLLTQAQLAQIGLAREITAQQTAGNSGYLGYLPSMSGSSQRNELFNSYLPNVSEQANQIHGAEDAGNSLQGTANEQLRLIRAALDTSGVAINVALGSTTPSGIPGLSPGQSSIPIQNQMVAALNKIVWNTYAIANNTNYGPRVPESLRGTYGMGGWIGGQPHSAGGTNINAELGEFMVRRDIAQMNKSWLSDFNATGRLPFNDNGRPLNVVAPVFRGGNDNGNTAALLAEMKRMNDKIERLEAVISGSDAMTRRVIEENGDKVKGSVEGQTKARNSQERQSNLQRKVANG